MVLLLEQGKENAENPSVLATACDAHDSVSIGSKEMSLGSDENSNARARNENYMTANVKFSVMI